MSTVLISGLINIETTLLVEAFPILYDPVRYNFFGISSSVSGVGFNIAKAMTRLGDDVRLLALIGRDILGDLVQAELANQQIPLNFVVTGLDQTAQSVILYDKEGRRQIHLDLKDIQEQQYPIHLFEKALASSDLAILCNVNYSRPFLSLAKKQGVPIATDVHAISDLDDPYNHDFLTLADILFMSSDSLPTPPEKWARQIQERFETEIVVIGLGASGALLAVKSDGFLGRFPAVRTRTVVNTIGAGDALFSAFNHFYSLGADPYQAIKLAIFFASYKVGSTGAANGFLDETSLKELIRRYNSGDS